MERRSKAISSVMGQRIARDSAAAIASTDGRWALVTTSLTAVIAGTIAWLAVGTMPPLKSHFGTATKTTFLPYQLFQKLTHGSYASIAPFTPSAAKPTAPVTDTDEAPPDDDTVPGIQTRTITMDKGDTLAGSLEDAGISSDDSNAAVAALGKVYNVRNLRAGQSFELTYATQIQVGDGADPSVAPVAKLASVTFSPSIEHDVTIARDDSGVFAAQDTVKQLVEHQHRAGATIEGSLYLSAMKAGVPADVVVEMIHMFSYEVDFQRDIRPGNSFEVYYSYYYTPEGRPARNGNIAYATMHLGGRTVALYRYQPDPREPADYFDAHGQSAKSMLMKTPVDGARITSGFGMRMHPLLGYTRMHKGIDFGVPLGTPVMAAGSGTVELSGWRGGYGNFLKINHGNGYATGYGHLSRFAPGIHPGARVRQGQVVAYSGSTGESTGPHLHYETFKGGTQVNPLTLKIAHGRILQGHDLREFQIARLHTDAVIASQPLETKVADISTDLRQAKVK